MPYVIDQEKCEKDDNCFEACPVEAIEKKDDGCLIVKVEDCTDCGACELVCNAGAIQSAK